MTRWTDEYGAREFCPLTWTVRIVAPPVAPPVVKHRLSPAEEVALSDLTRGRDER